MSKIQVTTPKSSWASSYPDLLFFTTILSSSSSSSRRCQQKRYYLLEIVVLSVFFTYASASSIIITKKESSDHLNQNINFINSTSTIESTTVTANTLSSDFTSQNRNLRSYPKYLDKEFSAQGDSSSSNLERVIVQYTNKAGKQLALSLAKSVYHEFDEDDTIVIDVDPYGLSILKSNANIKDGILASVEPDEYWVQEGILEQIIDPSDLENFIYGNISSSADHPYFHRDLQNRGEQVPYGIKMVQATSLPVGPYRASVCVVDTGIKIGHPDFNRGKVNGANRVSASSVNRKTLLWNNDIRGHGTHIAGTIAARAYNSYGVRGMGDIPLYITRGLSDEGDSRESDIIDALKQCANAGAKVISLSLSGNGMSTAMKKLIDQLYGSNVMIVAASGNDGQRAMKYPASYNKVVSVGAVDESKNRWIDSNYGPWLELVAPGVAVVSTGFTVSGDYTLSIYTGTSMATPHVAGAAALLWSHYPTCTVTQIRYALAYTALDRGSPGCDEMYGYGIVKVKRAWNFLRVLDCKNAAWGRVVGDGTCSAIDQYVAMPQTKSKSHSNAKKNTKNHSGNGVFQVMNNP